MKVMETTTVVEDEVKERMLEAEVGALLPAYTLVILGSGWKYDIKMEHADEMPDVAQGGIAAMAVESDTGERRFRVYVNLDTNWEETPGRLEHAVKHELVHVLAEDMGVQDVSENMLDDLEFQVPARVGALRRQYHQVWEKFIDRIATLVG